MIRIRAISIMPTAAANSSRRRHRGLARRRVAVRRRAVRMLPEGVGQHVQLASTNKCLAQTNKSRTGGNATKKRNRHPWSKKVQAARSAQNVVLFKLAADGLRPFQKNEGPLYE
jgi:hypothetical protein